MDEARFALGIFGQKTDQFNPLFDTTKRDLGHLAVPSKGRGWDLTERATLLAEGQADDFRRAYDFGREQVLSLARAVQTIYAGPRPYFIAEVDHILLRLSSTSGATAIVGPAK